MWSVPQYILNWFIILETCTETQNLEKRTPDLGFVLLTKEIVYECSTTEIFLSKKLRIEFLRFHYLTEKKSPLLFSFTLVMYTKHQARDYIWKPNLQLKPQFHGF